MDEHEGMKTPCSPTAVADDFAKAGIERDTSMIRLDDRVQALEVEFRELEKRLARISGLVEVQVVTKRAAP